MTRRILVSLMAFFLFSLLGPFMRLIFSPTTEAGHFATIVGDVVLYIWPTTLLGAGRGIGWRTTLDLTVTNIEFFLIIGLVVGLIAWRRWVVVALYIFTCAAIFFVEAWEFKSSLGLLTWCALAIVFGLYAIPFWTVRYFVTSEKKAGGTPKFT